MIDYTMLANNLIDYLCERDGIYATINLLFDVGYTKKELIELKFDENDIENAIE